jgi:hypothetical protein
MPCGLEAKTIRLITIGMKAVGRAKTAAFYQGAVLAG